MAEKGHYAIPFMIEQIEDRIVHTTIERCVAAGFRPMNRGTEYTDPDKIIEANLDSGSEVGRMNLFLCDDQFHFKLLFDTEHDWPVYITIEPHYLGYEPDDTSVSEKHGFVDSIAEIVGDLAAQFDADYVCSCYSLDEDAPAAVPSEKPVHANISRLPWLGVYAPETVDAFGGRDHVLATPAWRVDELASGHVLIITTDLPFDPRWTPDRSPHEHLLGE